MSEAMQTEINQRLQQIEHPVAFLATVDSDGTPQVRPVTLMTHENHFYLATDSSCRKTIQIRKDNRVEFVTLFPEGEFTGYLRVMGCVERIDDSQLAETVTKACDFPVSKFWKGVTDPAFFFFQVLPKRVEYMKPGKFKAKEVTDEYIG